MHIKFWSCGTWLSKIVKTLNTCIALCLLAGLAFGQRDQKAEDLRLSGGKTIVLEYPSDISQISTNDPGVVDAVGVTTREILLEAKASGFATVIVWTKAGDRNIYNVTVDQNLDSLRRLLKETFPNEDIHIQSSRDSISLTGKVSSREVADRAAVLVAPFGKTVVNMLQMPPPGVEKQILLRVKFAELDRSKETQFGVNLLSTGATNTVGSIGTGQFAAPRPTAVSGKDPTTGLAPQQTFSITDALNIFAFRPDINLGAFIKALQAENILEILAEPNLVTTSGKEASFLVGGEFPIPILQGGGNAGAVTIQFREFGIRLAFNPIITENNTIKMHVKPEVSSIDTSNAITLSGFSIPALSTRRVETDIELAPGQSFVIGGLLDQRVQDAFNKLPGLGDIPLLGQLFRSRDVRKSRQELVILVTPEITNPMNPGDPKPAVAAPKEFLAPMQSSLQIEQFKVKPAAADGDSKKERAAKKKQEKKDKKEKKEKDEELASAK
jgi:pilus assembly protein CpaC